VTAVDDPRSPAATAVVPHDPWAAICPVDRLTPDRGVAALVADRQVAVFRLSDGSLHALDNVDPCSGAAVLSRGLVGDVGGAATVASPLHQQRFELATGRCLDADVPPLRVHDVDVVDATVFVRQRPAP
jgi:nitrite reductase (NADH) small subunit